MPHTNEIKIESLHKNAIPLVLALGNPFMQYLGPLSGLNVDIRINGIDLNSRSTKDIKYQGEILYVKL